MWTIVYRLNNGPVDALDLLSTIIAWTYKVVATWYGAAIVGGVLIFLAERLSVRAEPSDAEVTRAAEQYRQWYGERALDAIGDHMLAARFAPDSSYRSFLKRVSAELLTIAVSDENCAHAIEP